MVLRRSVLTSIAGVALCLAELLGQTPPPRRVRPNFPPDIVPPDAFTGRDALQVDPKHYQLEFENEAVRVIRMTLKANEASPMHDDQDALVVCLKECHIRIERLDGRTMDVHLESGKTRWLAADQRVERNLSTQTVEMLFVETKAAKK
jgi:hypothetical protein